MFDDACSLQCAWAALHLAGLVAAVLLRIGSNAAAESLLGAFYLLSLSAISVAALAGQQLGCPLWTLSAGTLGVMIVIAVADVGSPRRER